MVKIGFSVELKRIIVKMIRLSVLIEIAKSLIRKRLESVLIEYRLSVPDGF